MATAEGEHSGSSPRLGSRQRRCAPRGARHNPQLQSHGTRRDRSESNLFLTHRSLVSSPGRYGWVLSLIFLSWEISTWALARAIRCQVKTKPGNVGLAFLIRGRARQDDGLGAGRQARPGDRPGLESRFVLADRRRRDLSPPLSGRLTLPPCLHGRGAASSSPHTSADMTHGELGTPRQRTAPFRPKSLGAGRTPHVVGKRSRLSSPCRTNRETPGHGPGVDLKAPF
jgi:hypothetical protein